MGKQDREMWKAKAIDNNSKVESIYQEEIRESVVRSVRYGGPDHFVAPVCGGDSPEIIVDNIDSVGAIFKYADQEKKTAVLNFADFTKIGGRYIDGAHAQEESLCHESFLYSVLKEHPDYFKWNTKNKNKGLYKNRAIYTPSVVFFRDDDEMMCDVISCACPNKSLGIRYKMFTEEENAEALTSRIHFIHQIAAEQNVHTLILGALGCGVFRQDPIQVAEIFKEEFKTTTVKMLVFAIPGGKKTANYNAFATVFG